MTIIINNLDNPVLKIGFEIIARGKLNGCGDHCAHGRFLYVAESGVGLVLNIVNAGIRQYSHLHQCAHCKTLYLQKMEDNKK